MSTYFPEKLLDALVRVEVQNNQAARTAILVAVHLSHKVGRELESVVVSPFFYVDNFHRILRFGPKLRIVIREA